jgi:hypothetical protein
VIRWVIARGTGLSYAGGLRAVSQPALRVKWSEDAMGCMDLGLEQPIGKLPRGIARSGLHQPAHGNGENDEKFFFSCYLRRKKR